MNSFESFVGTAIFSFLLAYILIVTFTGIREVFPHDKKGLKIDFKHYD